jgi:2-iminobutanoate/2-iminopropanoate deaminase
MRREINPETFPKPQSNYSQGVVHGPIKERLVISGQVGVRPDGGVAEGLEAQMAQTWENFLAVLGSAGFQTADVVKVTVYVTEHASRSSGAVVRRRSRDSHRPRRTSRRRASPIPGSWSRSRAKQ